MYSFGYNYREMQEDDFLAWQDENDIKSFSPYCMEKHPICNNIASFQWENSFYCEECLFLIFSERNDFKYDERG